MSTKNKSVASKAILEMKQIKEAIERESTETIKTLLSDAVKDTLRENIESDDYVIIEGKKASNSDMNEDEENTVETQPEDEDDVEAQQTEQPEGAENAEETGEEAETPDEDSLDMSQYQVDGDPNTLDLTGEQDPSKVVKVFKLLQPDDDVVVRQTEDGKVEMKDGKTGAEYVIDLGTNNAEGAEVQSDEASEQLDEEYEFELEDESEPYTEDSDEFTEDLNGGEGGEPENQGEPFELGVNCKEEGCKSEELNENGTKKCMKKKERIFEVDLGYTDDYQKKDPIAGLSMDGETAGDEGLPTDKTTKPWSGLEQEQEPYEDTVNEEDEQECGMMNEEDEDVEAAEKETTELEEGTNVTLPNGRKKLKSHTPAGKKGANVKHQDSQAGKYEAEKIDEIVNENKAIKNEVAKLRKALREAYMTNVNLGKITRLFLENTTSQKEKIDIVNRFVNEAKTKEQSDALYESINNELKKNASVSATITEATIKAEKAPINETKIYESNDLKEMKDLMRRVMSC